MKKLLHSIIIFIFIFIAFLLVNNYVTEEFGGRGGGGGGRRGTIGRVGPVGRRGRIGRRGPIGRGFRRSWNNYSYSSWWPRWHTPYYYVPITYNLGNYLWGPQCKNGCTILDSGSVGCQYPGNGPDDCLFASDCYGC